MQIFHPTGGQGRISSPYGPRIYNKQRQLHPGLDFAVPVGTRILAPLAGEVIYQGNRDPKGYGLQVILRHGENLFTQFGHLSEILVKEGQRVRGGEVIGLSGNTGASSGPHLHFEVRVNKDNWKDRADPQNFLGGRLDLKKLIGSAWTAGKILPALLLTGGLITLIEAL